MAATSIPAPGKQARLRGEDRSGWTWQTIGPCLPTCEHAGCLANRRDAETRCPLCGWVIGYEVAHYRIEPGATCAGRPVVHNADASPLVHALCYEQAIEKERAR